MPRRTLRSCAYPACPNLVRSGYCAQHKGLAVVPMNRTRDKGVQRLYDRNWQKRRARQLAKEPWCEDCMAKGIYTPATEAHHTRRHQGDPVIFRTSPWSRCANPATHGGPLKRCEMHYKGRGIKSFGSGDVESNT